MLLANVGLLTYLFFKYRKEKSYLSTNRLYDMDMVLRRALFSIALSLIPGLCLMVLMPAFFPTLASVGQVFGYAITAIIVLAVFVYSLEHMATRFEPLLFPRKHQLHLALKKISRELGSITSFREMKEIILVDIVETLQVFGGAVVFHYHDHLEMISAGEIDTDEVGELINTEAFDGHPYYSCFVVSRHVDYTSYFIMTQKRTRTLLGQEELQWLNLIISYLAVSLENLYLIRTFTDRLQQLASFVRSQPSTDEFAWFRKLMFELQEKERVRIATDLHDTTLQDLFYLKRRLAGLKEQKELDPDTAAKVTDMIHYIEIINENLRQSCFELHPYVLQEVGLVKAVQKIIEIESGLQPFVIDLTVSGASVFEAADYETKRHVFRMVQELLNNAKKHSRATVVKFRLVSDDNRMSLWYEDNGVGFDMAMAATRGAGNYGVGLEQLKTRAVALNAQLNLETAPGKGVIIVLTIPLKERMPA